MSRPFALYLWSALLLIMPITLGAWMRMGAPPRALVAVTVLCVLAAVVAGMVVGSTLQTMRDVVRGAVIGGGMLSLGLFIIPVTVIDATSSSCTTLNCDLGPSLGAAALFALSSLSLFVVIGAGYRVRLWRDPR